MTFIGIHHQIVRWFAACRRNHIRIRSTRRTGRQLTALLLVIFIELSTFFVAEFVVVVVSHRVLRLSRTERKEVKQEVNMRWFSIRDEWAGGEGKEIEGEKRKQNGETNSFSLPDIYI